MYVGETKLFANYVNVSDAPISNLVTFVAIKNFDLGRGRMH